MLSLGIAVAFADTFDLVTGDDYPPFTGTALPNHGLAAEIVQTTFREMGHDTTLVFKPWKRGFEDTAAGKYFGTFPYSKNAERIENFYYSDPLYIFKQYFFARHETEVDFESGEEMRGLSVCVPVGYSHSGLKELQAEGIITLVRPPDIDSCFRMIAKKRVDLVRVTDLIGWAMIDKLFGNRDDFQMGDVPVREAIEHLIIPKTHPEGEPLIQGFNSALKDLQRQGKIHKLIERHLY